MVSDGGVVGHTDLAPDEHVATDGDGAGETGLRGDHRGLANLNIVSDVYLSIELAPAPQACGLQRPGVNRGERADLHIVFDVDPAELRHSQDLAVGPVGPAEPRSADDGACAHDDAVTDANGAVDHGTGFDGGILSDDCA